MTRLRQLGPGSIAVIVWPVGGDVVEIDRELAGDEVFVMYMSPCRKAHAFVRLVDPDTLRVVRGRGPFIVADIEVEEIISERDKSVRRVELADGKRGDAVDPLAPREALLSPPSSTTLA